MKKFALLTFVSLFALLSFDGLAQRKERAEIFANPQNYDAHVIAVGTTGTKYFFVTGTGKKVDGAIIRAQINAIHACIFKTIPGTAGAESIPSLYGLPEPKPEDEADTWIRRISSPNPIPPGSPSPPGLSGWFLCVCGRCG